MMTLSRIATYTSACPRGLRLGLSVLLDGRRGMTNTSADIIRGKATFGTALWDNIAKLLRPGRRGAGVLEFDFIAVVGTALTLMSRRWPATGSRCSGRAPANASSRRSC
jgi:hypothetical protein